MLFSSFEFLYLFLPLTVGVYFIFPKGSRNYVLLVASFIFYGIFAPKFLPLLIGVSFADWGIGLLVWKCVEKGNVRSARTWVSVAVISNALTLAFFKYLDPIRSALGLRAIGIELPSGISFYIFQALSYVFDVRRRAVTAQKDPLLFTTYVALFPQLVAGPIVRYSDIDGALRERTHSVSAVADGFRLFIVGLGKKVILANGAGEAWERLRLLTERDGNMLGAWLGVTFFAFQIYFDFSGYSDMAVGLGRIFGFNFPSNFKYPYTAKSITEFWRRWHITLSSWFREYVYIPLGGSRKGRARMYLNLFVVWALTGIWHGAAVNFLFWGLYFFLVLTLEKAFLGRILEKLPKAFCHAYALFFISFGWFIFAADGISNVAQYLSSMFGTYGFFNRDALYELWRHLPFLAVMAVGSTPLMARCFERLSDKRPRFGALVGDIGAVLLLLLCTCYLADGGYNPFLYFRF